MLCLSKGQLFSFHLEFTDSHYTIKSVKEATGENRWRLIYSIWPILKKKINFSIKIRSKIGHEFFIERPVDRVQVVSQFSLFSADIFCSRTRGLEPKVKGSCQL